MNIPLVGSIGPAKLFEALKIPFTRLNVPARFLFGGPVGNNKMLLEAQKSFLQAVLGRQDSFLRALLIATIFFGDSENSSCRLYWAGKIPSWGFYWQQ